MLVTCPNCSAEYDVPDRLLGPSGRKLRCARCATAFTAGAPEAAEPAPPPVMRAAPEPALPAAPALRAPLPEEKPPASRPNSVPVLRAALQMAAVLFAWAVSLGGAGAVGWLAISERAEVMQAWSPSVRAYHLLHLDQTPAQTPTQAQGQTGETETAEAAHPPPTSAASAEGRTAGPAASAMSKPASHPG